jgi:hypothetical protein
LKHENSFTKAGSIRFNWRDVSHGQVYGPKAKKTEDELLKGLTFLVNSISAMVSREKPLLKKE